MNSQDKPVYEGDDWRWETPVATGDDLVTLNLSYSKLSYGKRFLA